MKTSKTVKLILSVAMVAMFIGCGTEDDEKKDTSNGSSNNNSQVTNGSGNSGSNNTSSNDADTIKVSTVPFIVKMKADYNVIRIKGGNEFKYNVDWGDGTNDSGLIEDKEHTYPDKEIYTIKISGVYPKINFECQGYDNESLISVEQWGDMQWSSMEEAFKDCDHIVINASDTPNLSKVTNMSSMFATFSENETTFKGDIRSWDVSNITNMTTLFWGRSNFNQDISAWDVSKVKSMESMFYRATNFNQDISSWDVSNVENMHNMFFKTKSFNQDIDSWDVSKVQDMGSMFAGAESFNQDISSWDIGGINSTEGYAINSMFYYATAFNQDISSWDFSKITSLNDFMSNSGLSVANYDKLLKTLINDDIQDNVFLRMENIQYSKNAESARFELINKHGWDIQDGGLVK
jgi:surface protein